MAYTWDAAAETARFTEFWTTRRHSALGHTSQDWDARADDWERELREDPQRRLRSEKRVAETADYLRRLGLLTPEQAVVDIGCGPGRFVTEFAKTSGRSVGIDVSPRMAEYGAAFAKENGISNADFIACDFKTADIREMGWYKQFDLVFSSITPAMSDPDGMDKAESMSRAYCFNSSFVCARDEVVDAALNYAMPGVRHPANWDGRSFYAMFNLLWLRGRYPQVRYYDEASVDRLPAGRELAQAIVARYPAAYKEDKVIDGICRYLDTLADDDGLLDYPSFRRYAWLLWDVREDIPRDYSPWDGV